MAKNVLRLLRANKNNYLLKAKGYLFFDNIKIVPFLQHQLVAMPCNVN